MFKEEDFLQLSALQHFIFCQRQCALIHIEQLWFENQFTAEGRIMHDKAHEEKTEIRKNVRIERGIPLRSKELGLNGKADVVEFHKDESGKWIPFPIEYKRGKPKQDNSDKIQLCAQALCLEEILDIKVSCGAIFYGKTRHRFDVEFDEALRKETKEAVSCLHTFIDARKTPKPVYEKKCDTCSFFDMCMPKILARDNSVKKYLEEVIKEL